VNVWGDSIGAGIVDHLSQKEIRQIEADQAANDDYDRVPQDEEAADGKQRNNNLMA
jgi:hypothetical protein